MVTFQQTWHEDARQALAACRPDQVFEILLPYRGHHEARLLLAQGYYQSGNDGLALAMIALSGKITSLQECIWLRRGLVCRDIDVSEIDYYHAETSFARHDWEKAYKAYQSLEGYDPYHGHAGARLALLAFFEWGAQPQAAWQEGVWSHLEGAEMAKHTGDYDNARRLYQSAYNVALQGKMNIRMAHALLGMSDQMRVAGDGQWCKVLARAEELYDKCQHAWGQQVVSVLKGQNYDKKHCPILGITGDKALSNTPLRLIYPC